MPVQRQVLIPLLEARQCLSTHPVHVHIPHDTSSSYRHSDKAAVLLYAEVNPSYLTVRPGKPASSDTDRLLYPTRSRAPPSVQLAGTVFGTVVF